MQTRNSPSIQSLHRLAKEASISDFENMSKANLFHQLQRQCNIARLLRVDERNKKRKAESMSPDESNSELIDLSQTQNNHSSSSSSSSSPLKRLRLNKYDPIMLTPLPKKAPTFKFVRPNGTAVRFALDTLIDYLVSSGEFYDPETRIPFSDEDLSQIDQLAQNASLDKPSVLTAKNDTQFYNDARFHRDAIQGLERCAGEVIGDILNIVETCDPDDAQMQLVMREFPSFLDYYRQLRDADPVYATECLRQWKLLIQGPPNRPYIDEYGLLHAVCHFLKCVEECLI